MDKKLLKMATEAMRELELCEVRLKDGECEVYFRKNEGEKSEKNASQKQKAQGNKSAKEESALPSLDIENEVRAPLLGVFHRSEVGKLPYVEVGDSVRCGDVLCVIEAMKLLTQVKAEFDGVVEEIYAEEGSLVEFGQLLFVIKRD